MDVSAQNHAEWHAVTDRYAHALRLLQAGDRDARNALLAAYRQLKAITPRTDPVGNHLVAS